MKNFIKIGDTLVNINHIQVLELEGLQARIVMKNHCEIKGRLSEQADKKILVDFIVNYDPQK